MTIPDNNKAKRGRPAVNSTFVGVRLPPDALAALDAWIARRAEPVSRPEAIRHILAAFLNPTPEPVQVRRAKATQK